MAKDFPSTRHLPKIATEASGALWVPPAMMVKRAKKTLLDEDQAEQTAMDEMLKAWSAYGEERYIPLCKDSRNTGVYLREIVGFSREKIDLVTLERYKQMRGFQHSISLMKEKGLSDLNGQIKDAFSFVGPIIDPQCFGTWLIQECTRKGAHFIQGAIRGLLSEQADALKMTYGVEFIVNCSGLGSIELAGDQGMYPVRGSLLMVQNDGSLFPKIDFCVEGDHTSFGLDEKGQEIHGTTYLFPRGEDRLMLGSFYQPNRGDLNLTISAPYVQSMLRQCKELCPRLKVLKDSDVQVTVGIRPARKHGIRVEQDPYEPSIFHNYGHYRWGMTLCWGAARDITNLINNAATRVTSPEAKHLSKL
ncbi:D-amino-acid oxidase-like isoform X2 [Oculina patagonica]